jgi:ribosome-associated toxin RatA of RatAB toxin-antitoxin module
MRQLTMRTAVPRDDVAEVYRLLSDFAGYPAHAASVRAVHVREGAEGEALSDWEVDFRGGVLRWTEQDHFFPKEARVTFRQTAGDLDVFTGIWEVQSGPDSCVVQFSSHFDLGIPTLEDVLEPIAEQALYENVESILIGLFGSGSRVLSAVGEPVTPVGSAHRES